MIADIYPYMSDLASLGSSFPPEMLLRLWPAMGKEAGVGEMPIPDSSSLETVLPLVAMSISRKRQLKQGIEAEVRARIGKAKSWPDKLYNVLQSSDGNSTKAQEWLRGRVDRKGVYSTICKILMCVHKNWHKCAQGCTVLKMCKVAVPPQGIAQKRKHLNGSDKPPSCPLELEWIAVDKCLTPSNTI
eukprot:2362051-Amphidinium_carterae.1